MLPETYIFMCQRLMRKRGNLDNNLQSMTGQTHNLYFFIRR